MTSDTPAIADINSILAQETDATASLYQHALRLLALQERLRAALPAPLADHFAVANCSRATLVLYADSAAWAARLRFRSPELLRLANRDFPEAALQSVRVKVRPAESGRQRPPPGKLSISGDTARLLRQMADSIPEPDLSATLLRLSRHTGTD